MKKTVAIIGSGMAGLAAARLLKDAGHEVTVFEALAQRGMDSHTVFLNGGIVDVPLRVMSPLIWTNTLALARHVGVNTFGVETFVSCSWLAEQQQYTGHTWFRTTRLPFANVPMLGSWRHVNRNALIVLKEFVRLALQTYKLNEQQNQQLSLGEFMQQHDFHPLFWRGVILPILTTICTCDESYLLAWPALRLLQMLDQIMHGVPLVRLQGGTPALVKGLAQDIHFVSGSAVTQLRHVTENGVQQVLVANARGEQQLFDYAIVATPTNQLDFLNEQQFGRELQLLRQFKFDRGELWVHRDLRFMPLKRREWTALSYSIKPDLSASMFTVWVNAVEPSIKDQPPVFQTWNPLFEPQADQVISRTALCRAVVDHNSQQALQALEVLHQEAGRQVFFAGSWASMGIPLLESAVQSAMRVAKHLQVPISFGNLPNDYTSAEI